VFICLSGQKRFAGLPPESLRSAATAVVTASRLAFFPLSPAEEKQKSRSGAVNFVLDAGMKEAGERYLPGLLVWDYDLPAFRAVASNT
jgi:hypothetical protein